MARNHLPLTRYTMQAFVALDTVCWPGDLDIAPETLYDRSIPFPD